MTNENVKFENLNGDEIICLITDFEANEKTKGFKISFRYYNVSQESGGFESTYWVSNCDKSLAKGFCGLKHEAKSWAKLVGATITSFETKNKVGAGFTFSKMKSKLVK